MKETPTNLLNAAAIEASKAIHHLAETQTPRDFEYFVSCFIGAAFGPFCDEMWKQFEEQAKTPCGRPGCDCHVGRTKLFEGLDAMRADYRKLRDRSYKRAANKNN